MTWFLQTRWAREISQELQHQFFHKEPVLSSSPSLQWGKTCQTETIRKEPPISTDPGHFYTEEGFLREYGKRWKELQQKKNETISRQGWTINPCSSLIVSLNAHTQRFLSIFASAVCFFILESSWGLMSELNTGHLILSVFPRRKPGCRERS